MKAGSPFTCQLLTPVGRSAVATVAASGAGAQTAIEQYFFPASAMAPDSFPVNRIRFGRWRRTADQVGEELVVCRIGEGHFEIHCHGGSAAAEAILEDLTAFGGTASAAVHPGGLTGIQAQAMAALAEARTERSAAILLDQYRGALAQAMDVIAQLAARGQTTAARQQAERLLSRWEVGRHLTQPYRVVLAGPPNVGKSSLINALLGFERAIVYAQPGTTRDVVSAATALEGWPVELSDTAGLRQTDDPLEAAGMERAKQQLARADLVLWVRDYREAAAPEGMEAYPPELPAPLLVWNKWDLADGPPLPPQGVAVSALRGDGLAQLQREIVARLVPQPPAPGDAVPYLEAHCQELLRFLQ